MNPALSLLAPFVLLMPLPVAAPIDSGATQVGLAVPRGPMSLPGGGVLDLRMPDAAQVRIEQSITIRISPRPAPMPLMPAAFASQFEGSGGMPRFMEKKMGNCLGVASILGVQPGPGNRLILMLRDSRMVAASLPKNCQSRDFYSGFLVSKNGDGMICTGRDQLLARNGANCQVSGFRQLIAVGA